MENSLDKMEDQNLKFSRKSLLKKKRKKNINERTCHYVEKVNKQGWGRVYVEQKNKYFYACFPVKKISGESFATFQGFLQTCLVAQSAIICVGCIPDENMWESTVSEPHVSQGG